MTLTILYVVCGLMQVPSHDMREADDVLLLKVPQTVSRYRRYTDLPTCSNSTRLEVGKHFRGGCAIELKHSDRACSIYFKPLGRRHVGWRGRSEPQFTV